MTDPAIEAKKREADIARDNFLSIAHELQARLKLDALAERAVDRLREKSEDMADGAVDAIRQRPVAATAAATGIVALIAAGPIVRLVRWMRSKDQQAPEGAEHAETRHGGQEASRHRDGRRTGR